MKNKVEVEIMGHKLQIRSDSDESYIQEVASHVDTKVKEILSKTKSVASTQVVILAAMNIADEFFRFKESRSSKNEEIAKKIDSVIEHIDLRL